MVMICGSGGGHLSSISITLWYYGEVRVLFVDLMSYTAGLIDLKVSTKQEEERV
jgi:hypothetical protein